MQAAQSNASREANPDAGIRLAHFARQLAQTYSIDDHPKNKTILAQHLQSWKQTLHAAYLHFRAESAGDLAFSRAGEWMLDNFYVVEQTLHQVREDLPKSFYNELPKLSSTALKDYPHVFGVAWEWVNYSQKA